MPGAAVNKVKIAIKKSVFLLMNLENIPLCSDSCDTNNEVADYTTPNNGKPLNTVHAPSITVVKIRKFFF